MDKIETNILKPFTNENINSFSVIKYKDILKKYIENQNMPSKEFEVVILGAGKGTRMKVNYPKILYKLDYPSGKKSILDNTIENLRELSKSIKIQKINLIIDKENSKFFEKYLGNNDINIVELEKSCIRGTAVSISAVKEILDPECETIFIWGDIALWRTSDLHKSISAHILLRSDLTFCTRFKKDPYVAFIRNNDGVISSIIHSNESAGFKGFAEQDCLQFICSSDAVQNLDELVKEYSSEEDIDFIHLIPFLSGKKKRVVALPIAENNYISGLNTPEKAEKINKTLRNFSHKQYKSFFTDPLCD